jgi:serine/threonine protein kinase
MSENDDPDLDETIIRQESDDEKTTVKGSPVVPSTGNGEATIIRGGQPVVARPEPDNDKTTVKDSTAIPEGSAEATIIRAPESNKSATILREPAGDNATILRSSEGGDATILRGPDDEATILGGANIDDRTVMRDGDDDSTVLNANTDDDSTIIGNPEDDTTYIASLERQPESKGNTEAGRLLKNRFVLEEKIGSGGMGDVYKALDLRQQEAQDKDPYIAVKLLNDSFSRHKDAFVSLQREVSRMRGIPHPNIMAVFDFDKEGTTVFMTAELLDGKPLDDYLKEHPEGVSEDDARNIVDGICEGLKRAHNAGIVHSDFKPGNIFYTKDKTAKVFDFGIARAVSNPDELEAEGEKTVFDAGSLGALTPTYASYEMLKGMDPSKSDDVYAVALVAYELFGGKHPYDRVPADKALDRGLKPKRLAGLKRRHWKALEKALALKGEDRTQTIDEFHANFFSEDPPYLRYAAIAATLVAAAGAVTYSALNEKVKPEEVTQWETASEVNRTTLNARLSNAVFDSPDWHDQVESALRQWKATDFSMAQNPDDVIDEWAIDWGVVLASVDDPDSENDIPSMERRVLDTYVEEITRLRKDAQGFGRSQEEVEQAIGILEQAEGYLVVVKEHYAHIDRSSVNLVEGMVDQGLEQQRFLLANLLEKARIEAERVEAARLADEATKAREEREEKRNTEYLGHRKELESILKCKGNIPPDKLEDAGVRLRAMKTLFPEQFALDTPGIVTAFEGCIKRRIGYADPERARDVKRVVMSYLPGESRIIGIEIDDRDPCMARGLEGQGDRSRSFCSDRLGVGGAGPQLVVIPAGGRVDKFAISKTEVKVADYNQFCEKTGCQTLAGSRSIPATNLSVTQATAYMTWLSQQSGKTYRLPTVDEWELAARGEGEPLDDNINCTVDSRGVRLGEKLLSTLSGKPNGYGLFNHVGNAREWAVQADGSLVALGGAHTDPKAECTLDKRVAHGGVSDPVTGFRVLRIIPPVSS